VSFADIASHFDMMNYLEMERGPLRGRCQAPPTRGTLSYVGVS
jgi:hypothetical protein